MLDIVPEEGVATEQFLTRLASYVESFALFRKRLRALHGRTVGKDVAPSNQAAPAPDVDADVAAEGDMLPLARMVGVKPVSLRVDLQVHPASAQLAPTQPQPVHPLVGRWDMGTGRDRIPLEIYEQSGTLKLRLAEKHFAIGEVEGVVVPAGSRHTVRGMVYAMRTGERLNLGDCALRERSDSEMTVTCPMVRGSFTRGFRTTTEQKTSTLYRVE